MKDILDRLRIVVSSNIPQFIDVVSWRHLIFFYSEKNSTGKYMLVHTYISSLSIKNIAYNVLYLNIRDV